LVKVKGFKKKDKDKGGKRAIWGIKAKTLKMILEASKETYPNEFSATLRAEGGVINEVVMLPGTLQGETSAILRLHMLPIDYTVVGSVHSHPSGVILPSEADLVLFEKFGRVHIIVGTPFNMGSWRAFDFKGNPIGLEIVD
jgi:proteasome lid subunit RPN8/RPN11